MTLTEFLLARIAEDEEVARACADGDHERGNAYADAALYPFLDRFDSGRALAECEAKRRIVVEHAGHPCCETCYDIAPADAPCPTIRALALPYADHPDFREAWRA